MSSFSRRFWWSGVATIGLICFFLSPESFAQVTIENNALLNEPLAAIEITGNKETRSEIILREMESQPCRLTSQVQLRRDQLRVKSLNLFNRVEFRLERRSQGPVLVISVTEKWYIFPIPYWYFKDEKPDQLVYGFRYNQRNFRGRNETLSLDFWSGADRGFRFSHNTPWMENTPQLRRSLELYQVTRESQRAAVKGLEERASQFALGIGKRWTIKLISDVNLRFRLTEGIDPLQLASGGLIDRILEAEAGSIWDSRDLATFPMEGFYLRGSVSQGWILDNSRKYQKLLLDARSYLPLQERISLASRMILFPGWGYVPPYDWMYLSEGLPIRTGSLTDEGRSFYMLSVETRFELTRLHYFTWKKAPYFPQYFRNLEYGLGAEIFADCGDAYNDERETGFAELKLGYGAGLLLRLPYVEVVRLEFALNPKRSVKEASLGIKSEISF